MARWVKPLTQLATAKSQSRNLQDEDVLRALMEQAGVKEPEPKFSFLERLGTGLNTFRWSDDYLKSLKEDSGMAGFLGSYLADIPRTLAGSLIGNREWADPDEGGGVQLMEHLGVDSPFNKYLLGTVADIVTPDLFVSAALKEGVTLTKAGTSFVDDIAKASAGSTDDAVKLLSSKFGLGDDVAKSISKRVVEGGDDILDVAQEYISQGGLQKGLLKKVDPGMYLGYSAEKGTKIAGGTAASYLGRAIENPIFAPFQIGGDVLRKSGLTQSKALQTAGKFVDEKMLKKFDFLHELKKTPELGDLGGKLHAVNQASEYEQGKVLRKFTDFFKTLPDAEKAKLYKENVAELVEFGGGLPQKTSISQYIKGLEDSYQLLPEEIEMIGKNLDEVSSMLGKDIKSMDFTELVSDPSAWKGLRHSMGGYSRYLDARVEFMGKQSKKWGEFIESVGYEGNAVIESIDDVHALQKSIGDSGLDYNSKVFYNEYVAKQFGKNIETAPLREALGEGVYGPGYMKRTYIDRSTEPLKEAFKKKLLDPKKRMFDSLTDVEVYNKFNTEKLQLEAGAEGLAKQISYRAGQDQAAKQIHETYTSLIEQVKQGTMPKFGIGDTAEYGWVKTGIPMLDEAGIKVEAETWELLKDVNMLMVGERSANELFGIANKLNTWWRGWTTAWTVNVAGAEIPVNPAYYVRNWVNNKFSAVLYGGVNPTDLPTRMYQGNKVWKYLAGKNDGSEVVGHLTVKELGDKFVRSGGMGSTNIEDIRRIVGEKFDLLGSGDLAQQVEISDKIAIFIDQKLKNIGDIPAMKKTNFALFDYSSLTSFEREYMQPMYSFYTWSRKNLESLFRIMATDPKKVKMFNNMFAGLGDLADKNDTNVQELLPDYMRDLYSVIMGGGDQVGAIYGFGTNLEAVGGLLGSDMKETTQNQLALLAPGMRIPLELATDYSFFKDRKLSEDTSGYSMRNLPESVRNLMGVTEKEYVNKGGNTVKTYKVNPYTKYAIENLRPIGSLLKLFDIGTNEGLKNETFLDILNYASGMRYRQYDTEYLRMEVENARYKQVMEDLMDAGYVNQYQNYYVPK